MVYGRGEDNDSGEKDDGEWLVWLFRFIYGSMALCFVLTLIYIILKR